MRWTSVALTWMVLLAVLESGRAAADSDVEHRIKAEFVERFTRFVDWPPTAFPSPRAPLVIGVLGAHPIYAPLVRIAREREVKGRPLVVRRLTDASQVEGCHVVFISGKAAAELPAVIARTRGKPILTIADTPGFGALGVVINLFVEGGFVRFEINEGVARGSSLHLSSRLLKLGRPVAAGPR